MADEGWRLFGNYESILARAASDAVACCGAVGTSAHESALLLADRVLMPDNFFQEATAPPRRPHAPTKSCRKHVDSLKPEHIAEKLEEILREYEYFVNSEVALLKAQVYREYLLTREDEESEHEETPVTADVRRGIITVNGVEHSAPAHHCQIVKALLDAEGLNVTGPEMDERPGCRGKKFSREIKNLEKKMPALMKYIIHDGNKGYRLVSG